MFDRLKVLCSGAIGIVKGFTIAPLKGIAHGQMFVQADGTTDLSRVLGALAVLTYLFIQTWAVLVLKQPFDAGAFGGGLSAVCGGAGALILAHNFATH
ncbi:MAG: hypothetical protein WBR15_02730 [Gammaproteobacteria bacterium]